jgi:ketosteroid isomerase-like protein
MSRETALKLLHDYHDAWERGDREAGIAFFSETVVVHMGGNGPLARDYDGREDFVGNWIERVAAFTDNWEVIGNDVLLVGDDGVLLMVHEAWTKDDRRVATNRLGLYRFAGGEIVECWFSDMNQPEVEAFFAGMA